MPARILTLQSPAKINLYLEVLRKRPDGFHDIVTLFERIDLFDVIKLKALNKNQIVIKCAHKDVPLGPKNLVYKIAESLKQDFNITQGVEITIKKNIPVAAGLAGGSTNAATVLMGLNRLWNLKLSRKQMLNYARQVGSDVAFFLSDASWALGTNRGDVIQSVKLSTKLWHVIVVPEIKLFAKDVYQALGLNVGGTNVLTTPKQNVTILLRQLKKSDLSGVGRYIWNDLERPILKLCPQLSKLKDKLNSLNTQGVMISGSGPAVFGLTKSKSEAKSIAQKLSKKYRRVFVVRTL